jgi:hypothetical protein
MSNKMSGVETPAPIAEVEFHKRSDAEFDAELNREMVKRTDKLNDASIDLALRVKQAREFLAWSTNHMRGTWLDWQEKYGLVLKDTVQSRMAFERETKLLLGSAKDTRDFFNSPDYIAAHDRLKEMVTLLDQFSKLKADGTLDAFADFILKVSCR